MARNYQKDSGGGDYYPYPTPTPEPRKRRSKTPYPTMSPTATGYALRGTDRTPTPTPWPPKMYGTPTPEYLEYLGYPMGVRELGGSSGFGFNGTGGGGGIASKRMRKASDKPKPSDPYTNSGMHTNARGMSTLPSRSDAYIPYTTDPSGSKLTHEQRGRMIANTVTSSWAKNKINDAFRPIIMSALMVSPLAPFLGLAAGGKALAESKTGKNVIRGATDLYGTAAENAKGGVREVQMLPKAVRQANQSILNELNGRSYGDYAIDSASNRAKSLGNYVSDSGNKASRTLNDAFNNGWKQRKSEYKNSAGIGELIGVADELGLNANKRKELLNMGGRTAGKTGKVAGIAAQYLPPMIIANYLMNQIPSNVRARGVVGNAKSAKNFISDFVTNNGRKLMSEAGAMGRNALSSAGNSISSFFDKSATSSRGSRSMSKSLKSNKNSNKYF